MEPKFTASDPGKTGLGDDVIADASIGYAGSREPRRQNVERAAELEDGWLVPPGGVFFYVENVGRVDRGNGFETRFGIVADEAGAVTTAPVIGGGICQVSTTIFQAAFWAGMPIVERYQHPSWVTGYGYPPRGIQGPDAMVNIEEDGALDMKFENAAGDWFDVVVVADGETLSSWIVGRDPGWDVAVDGPEIATIVPKDEKMVYTDSSELTEGEALQVETAQDGFDEEINRTVTRDCEVIDELTSTSSFAPARNMTLRGTDDR